VSLEELTDFVLGSGERQVSDVQLLAQSITLSRRCSKQPDATLAVIKAGPSEPSIAREPRCSRGGRTWIRPPASRKGTTFVLEETRRKDGKILA
jgi:hypothetical protein